MMWTVIITNQRKHEMVARFQVEARSISEVLESGIIRREVGERAYDGMVIFEAVDDENWSPAVSKAMAGFEVGMAKRRRREGVP